MMNEYGMQPAMQGMMMPASNTMMQGPQGPAFEMEPEFLERIVEIPRIHTEHVERLVEVPQPQVVDRIVEVPMIQEIIKEEAPLPGEQYIVPIEREAPVIEFIQETLPPLEIAHVEYQNRYVEVPQIQEVLRVIPRVQVKEIPIERIIQVPKKIIQEIERPVYRPVPHLVQQAVERQIPVARPQIQTLEVVRQVPYSVTQPVDVQVNYPMPVPVATPQPMSVTEVPVPYPVETERIVERIVEKPVIQTQIVEKRVEVPVAVPVPQVQQAAQFSQQAAPVQTRAQAAPVQTMQMVSRMVPTTQTQVQVQEIVHAPYNVGTVREVSANVQAPTPPQSYRPMTVQAPMATVGVDANRDGRANYVVSGVDMNRDGIPDVLQQGAPMTMPMTQQRPGSMVLPAAMSSYAAPSTIMASGRVGPMTPPTPPAAARPMTMAAGPPVFSSRGPPMTMAGAPMTMVAPPMSMVGAAPYATGPLNTSSYTATAPTVLGGSARELVVPGMLDNTVPGGASYGYGVPSPPMPPRGIGSSQVL